MTNTSDMQDIMFEIIKYTPEYRQQWDEYVAKARNATFLFYRNYITIPIGSRTILSYSSRRESFIPSCQPIR